MRRALWVLLFLGSVSAARASEPVANEALVTEHRARSQHFAGVSAPLVALLDDAWACAPEAVGKLFDGRKPRPSAEACAPVAGAPADGPDAMNRCYAARYAELDRLVDRLRIIATLPAVRDRRDACAFNDQASAHFREFGAFSEKARAARVEPFELLERIATCNVQASRLVKVKAWKLKEPRVRAAFEAQGQALMRAWNLQPNLALEDPVTAWMDCRAAVARAQEILESAARGPGRTALVLSVVP